VGRVTNGWITGNKRSRSYKLADANISSTISSSAPEVIIYAHAFALSEGNKLGTHHQEIHLTKSEAAEAISKLLSIVSEDIQKEVAKRILLPLSNDDFLKFLLQLLENREIETKSK
jgi:hypothetical protein